MDPFLPDDQKVAALRDALPATGAGIFLDVAGAGPLPSETDRAMRESDEWELRVGRVGPDRAADLEVVAGEARAVIAAVIGADPDRIVLAGGLAALTTALLLARPVVPGERWSLTGGLSPGITAAARAVAGARGVPVDLVDDPALEPAAGTRQAGLPIGVAIAAHVHAETGVRALPGELWQPIAGAADRRPSGGTWRIVDASGSAGAIPLDLADLGADAVLLPGDRWLLGPGATAGAWCGPSLGETFPGRVAAELDALPRRSMLGLARSVGWILMYVGLPWALERTRLLTTDLLGRLWAIPGVELLTRPERCAATVAFRITGWSADETAVELGRRALAIVGRAPARDAIRCSVGAWTTQVELVRFADAVAVLARHAPGALPRRPRLVVLSSGDEA